MEKSLTLPQGIHTRSRGRRSGGRDCEDMTRTALREQRRGDGKRASEREDIMPSPAVAGADLSVARERRYDSDRLRSKPAVTARRLQGKWR